MTQIDLSALQHVTYQHMPQDVHLITFQHATREAVDEYIQLMDRIYDGLTETDMVRLIIDYRQSGIPPMRHLAQQGVKWANSLSIHPTARMAILHQPDLGISLLGLLVRSYNFGHLSTRFFKDEAGYQASLDWLHA
ncbi:MAG: hypothetical protein ACFE0Q_18795 [Anaerolineae bacterium]